MKIHRLGACVLGLSFLLSACMGDRVLQQRTSGVVERLYVIDCGENHAKDLSAWTTAADRDKPYVFANHCYLIKHATGWMLWDSGIADRVAGLPNGVSNPRGTLTQTLKRPLVDSLKEVGVSPVEIGHFAMSHSHGDHAGNANLFAASTLYMQGSEHDAVFGPEPQKYNFTAANFEKLRTAKVVRLNGDHDVFGDGSVVIKSTPGHTPGHQSLFVRLPKSGPVLLSGDFVHLTANWEAKRVPSINHDAEKSLRSMDEMDTFIKATGARLLINHDREQSASIPKSPAFLE